MPSTPFKPLTPAQVARLPKKKSKKPAKRAARPAPEGEYPAIEPRDPDAENVVRQASSKGTVRPDGPGDETAPVTPEPVKQRKRRG